jgi:hypothetical protein
MEAEGDEKGFVSRKQDEVCRILKREREKNYWEGI